MGTAQKLKQWWTIPNNMGGRDVRFQDDYDGMHAYVECGDREERWAVDDVYAEQLRVAEGAIPRRQT